MMDLTCLCIRLLLTRYHRSLLWYRVREVRPGTSTRPLLDLRVGPSSLKTAPENQLFLKETIQDKIMNTKKHYSLISNVK